MIFLGVNISQQDLICKLKNMFFKIIYEKSKYISRCLYLLVGSSFLRTFAVQNAAYEHDFHVGIQNYTMDTKFKKCNFRTWKHFTSLCTNGAFRYSTCYCGQQVYSLLRNYPVFPLFSQQQKNRSTHWLYSRFSFLRSPCHFSISPLPTRRKSSISKFSYIWHHLLRSLHSQMRLRLCIALTYPDYESYAL